MKFVVVDSFTDRPFRGNPAAVCLCAVELPDTLMLQIAQEFNLSETAFVVSTNLHEYSIRYFSPKMEIPLCGHATLAAADTVMPAESGKTARFVTANGVTLTTARVSDGIEMQFPVYGTKPYQPNEVTLSALGVATVVNAVFNAETGIVLLELANDTMVRNMQPDFDQLRRSVDGINGVVVTARGTDEYDFHSRYFWPWSGSSEDPVTGGTHTFLAPYWSERLGKSRMRSFQSSARTGFMEVELSGETLKIIGKATRVFAGETCFLAKGL